MIEPATPLSAAQRLMYSPQAIAVGCIIRSSHYRKYLYDMPDVRAVPHAKQWLVKRSHKIPKICISTAIHKTKQFSQTKPRCTVSNKGRISTNCVSWAAVARSYVRTRPCTKRPCRFCSVRVFLGLQFLRIDRKVRTRSFGTHGDKWPVEDWINAPVPVFFSVFF